MSKATALSVPTLDHYLPMIFAIALQEKDDDLEFVYEGFQINLFPCAVLRSD